ncbi:MAG: single-stranded-DNA-specific exonuclease RecJ [Gammaproteobacteria bacterium]|nr:single-stranded-DNA-specific exonuclease RecJ [Gammaproteobacteria bacterium]
MSAPRSIRRREPGRAAAHLPQTLPLLLRRVYANRNIVSTAELDHSLGALLSHSSLAGVGAAAVLLADAIAANERIMIIADYDADGATACALAIRGLRSCGARHVDYLVPDRMRDGYGLQPPLAESAARAGAQVLITVDNGIAAHEGIARAAALGMKVLVTDHHLPGASLPGMCIIVNPNQPGDVFPSKAVAGVGVMFYVLAALRQCLRERGWFARQGIEEPNLASLLDLVALGTVADVVSLDHNNRIFVAQGLARIRAGRGQPGVRALLAAANRDAVRAVSNDLAFAAGPRLNAAGRLTDMRLGIECLLTDDRNAAHRMAVELDRLNRERRQIQAQMQEQALNDLGPVDAAGAAPVLCIYRAEWHAGVVGVLAAQIKERVHRPVIAFARDADGMLKGSARSVSGIHIRDVIANVNAVHPGLIARFGGHAMAAGLTLAEANLDHFARAVEAELAEHWPAPEATQALWSDGELADADFTLETAMMLRDAGPWGQSFPEPLFDGEFTVSAARVVGNDHLKLSLAAGPGRRALDAIAFNQAGDVNLGAGDRAHLAYRLDVNEYNGRQSVQLVVEQISAG